MISSDKNECCPRCNSVVHEGDAKCPRCGYNLMRTPLEGPLLEVRRAIADKWVDRAKSYGKWGVVGLIPGIILVLLPLFVGRIFELLPFIVLGIVLLVLAGISYALSIYIEGKIEKGEKPFD